MKKNYSRGFTLIELLVVIAIIGILASVVLASLNSARNKGADAAIKAAMTNARAQAELFYDTGTTYEGVCALTGTNVIGGMILNAAQKLGGTASVGTDAVAWAFGTTGASPSAVCHDLAGGWAAMVSLKSSTTNTGWCVVSAGNARETATVLAASAIVCP